MTKYQTATYKALNTVKSVFFDTEVKVIKVTKSNAYRPITDDTETVLCTVKADIQPYSGELASKDYGLQVECQKKMYCDRQELTIGASIEIESDVEIGSAEWIKEGLYVEIYSERYQVVYVKDSNLGAVVLLKAVIV